MNGEIADVFALLGVLLVFVFAFLSALLAVTGPLLDCEVPDEVAKRKLISRRALNYFLMLCGLDVIILLVVALLFDLTRRSITTSAEGSEFQTIRAGLWLVDLLLILTLITCSSLAGRVLKKKREVDKPPV